MRALSVFAHTKSHPALCYALNLINEKTLELIPWNRNIFCGTLINCCCCLLLARQPFITFIPFIQLFLLRLLYFKGKINAKWLLLYPVLCHQPAFGCNCRLESKRKRNQKQLISRFALYPTLCLWITAAIETRNPQVVLIWMSDGLCSGGLVYGWLVGWMACCTGNWE